MTGKDAANLARRLSRATQPDMVQVSPHRWTPKRTDVEVPEMTLARWTQDEGCTYQCVPFQERMARLDTKLLELLGLGHGGRRTIQRLGKAGFIELLLISPRCFVLNLDSYFNHLRRMAEDPWFWEKPENLKAYTEVLDV